MWLTLSACTREAPVSVPLPSATETTFSETALRFDGTPPKNLIIISLDTTRRDRIGRYLGLSTTPFLDARLASGVALDEHRSCSNWTAPSMLCLTTGHNPLDLGFWPASWDALVEDVPARGLPTLANALGALGFQSALVTSNPVFSMDFDIAQGFDTLVLRDFATAETLRAPALAQAEDLLLSGGPFYLHLHYFDPHREYCPPEDYRTALDGLPDVGFDLCDALPDALAAAETRDDAWREALLDRARALYDGELRYLDDQLALLWEDLEEMGALRETLVVFATDHGEQHLERGVIDHGFQLFAEENRAMAGFWAEGLRPLSFTGPTLHEDVAVTIATLFGATLPETASGVVVGAADAERVRRVFAYSLPDHGVPQLGIVSGDRVMHYDWAGVRSLHHTDADPAEIIERYSPDDPDVVGLWGEMQRFVDEISALWPHLDAPVAPGP